ncbi:MAG: proton-conducting transporter membrane subunit, partial [Elusimicrobiaceae bacterium]|nr:proton-conducting transporter membrane subunit [Elusimicrobiaceae bacterium]
MTDITCFASPAIAMCAAMAAAFIRPGAKIVLTRPAFALAAAAMGAGSWFAAGRAGFCSSPLFVFDPRVLFADTVLGAVVALAVLEQKKRADPAVKVCEIGTSMLFAAAAGLMLLIRAADSVLFVAAFALVSIALTVLVASGPDRKLSASACAREFYCGGFMTLGTLAGAIMLFCATGSCVLAPATGTGLFTAGALTLFSGLLFLAGAFPFSAVARNAVKAVDAGPGMFMTVAVPAVALLCAARLAPQIHAGGAAGGLVFAAVGALTAVSASIAGLYQTDLRKLVACVAAANAGWAICLFTAEQSLAQILFFLAAFMPALGGLFIVSGECGEICGSHEIASLNGLARRAPATALAGLLFIAVLAALPVTSGFAAKYALLAL